MLVVRCRSEIRLPPCSGQPVNPSRRSLLLVHSALLLTAILWGGNFTALKYLLDHLKPLDALIIRVGGAAVIFAIILLSKTQTRRMLPRTDLIKFMLLGFLGITIMNLAFVYGQSMIPATLASLVVTSNPIWTAIISRAMGGEPLTTRKIGGIALAMTGFLIVLFFGSGNGAGLGGGELKGMALIAIGPFSWAFYTVLSKPMLRTYSPIQTAAYTSIGGAIGLIPLIIINNGMAARMQDLNSTGWLAAIYICALGFVLAYILWYQGLQVLSPSQTAVYIYLVPVFGLVFARIFLGETITLFLVLGAAVILSGVILTNTARPKPLTDIPVPDLPG